MIVPLVSISGLPDEAAHAVPEYWRPIAARDKCPRCGVLKPLTRKIDGPVPLLEGTRSILAPLVSIGRLLVGRALYEAIRTDLPPHWIWEVIPDRRSSTIDPVALCVRPEHAPMAHAVGYAPECCRACGELKYPKGRLTYAVRDTLPGFPITQIRGGWLIAEKTYAERLLNQFPRSLEAEKFEVRDIAPDPIKVEGVVESSGR